MQVTHFSDCVDWDFKNQEWIIGQHEVLPISPTFRTQAKMRDGNASGVLREAAGIPRSLVLGRAGGLACGFFFFLLSLGVTISELRH